ncbi:uncharacterized protein LOC122565722 [Bombus pyrosoma]|uniref:uncharacterized protein LOC122565722 n=1 Tax=Bombus pyrosoma TaxID=396416 RepID=UPI001CB8D7A1|nr:uncharacterized protein LOC122565722 [Bombus pyrosoma]
MKEDWINWLKDYYSGRNHEVIIGTARTRNMMRTARKSEPCNSHEANTSREIFQLTQRPQEMSNLANVVCNFEKGYLSPSKKERAADEYKQKNFVKKTVESLEMECKIYNDLKAAQEISKCPERNKSNDAPMLKSWKRSSRIFRNPFKNDFSHSKPNSRNDNEFDGSDLSSEERILNTSSDSNRHIRRRLKELENSKCLGKSKMILSAFGRKASGLEICSTFLRSNSDSSSPSNCFTRAELMRKIDLSDSVRRFSPDKTKTMGSVDPYMTSSAETISTAEDSLPTTSTLIDDSPKSDNSMSAEISHVDKSPKVLGAFLKKPIDVENTFIDWIPTNGKRLPRKRSLKKLLSLLTRGKYARKFSSERNLKEEPQEFQDSGYDERSCSSMSLTSLISIADALRHQESSYFESNRRSDLKTFKSKNKSTEEKQSEAFCDTYRSAENLKGKQLLLTEVPREEVKLDLGSCYPPLSQTIRFPSPLVDELVPRPPNHPYVSKMPKNPFVTSTKIDNLAEFNSSHVYYNNSDLSLMIIKNDLYEVEFRRSCNDLPSSNVYSSSSSVTNHYDVPRIFLSKFENEILWMRKSKSKLNMKEEPIYDIPKSQSIERPTSSIYDDVLSLKRKGIHVEAKTDLNTRSLAQCDLESHYAITKLEST